MTAYTAEHLAALEAALATSASGPLRVEYEGRSVTYRNTADLIAVIAEVRKVLNPGPAPRARFAGFRRGYG